MKIQKIDSVPNKMISETSRINTQAGDQTYDRTDHTKNHLSGMHSIFLHRKRCRASFIYLVAWSQDSILIKDLIYILSCEKYLET